MKNKRLTLSALLIAIAPMSAYADVVAFDLVNSGSQNLIAHTNPHAGAFSSPGDGFEIFQRGVSGSIPFSVLDDSISIFPGDTLGIIDENNTDSFFGVVDTVNNDNPGGMVSATWEFDISGFSDLALSIDMGAMGDFESSDVFSWVYSIDGGASMTAFELLADESLSLDYTLASGTLVTLNDPMTVDGTLLNNQLQTFSSALFGTGSVLSLTLMGSTDGGSEAFAFQNIIIEGRAAAVPEPGTLALLGFGLGGLGLARRRRIS